MIIVCYAQRASLPRVISAPFPFGLLKVAEMVIYIRFPKRIARARPSACCDRRDVLASTFCLTHVVERHLGFSERFRMSVWTLSMVRNTNHGRSLPKDLS